MRADLAQLEPFSMILPLSARRACSRLPRPGSSVFALLIAALAAAALSSCQDASAPEPRAERTQDVGGEADPERMTLDMKTWTWIKTEYSDGTTKQPAKQEAFTLAFSDGRVQGTTDCNRISGAYTVDGRQIHFDDPFAMTRMFCPDSQENEFVAMLAEVDSFFFTSQGRLILEIELDSGAMHLR